MTLAGQSVLLAVESGGSCHAAFADLARTLARGGANVTLAVVDLTGRATLDAPQPFRTLSVGPPPVPLLCGLGCAGQTEPLRAAYALDNAVRSQAFDLAIAPLRGGLAHGLLMRRASGEPGAPSRIVLWGDAPTRWTVLAEDDSPDGLAPLVADAMERNALRLADAIIVADEAAAKRVEGLGASLPPRIGGHLPAPPWHPDEAGDEPIREIIHVGRLSRRAGAAAFTDAVEALARAGELGDRLVTFLGPLSDSPDAFGASLLGVRSTAWTFRFTVVNAPAETDVLAYLAGPGRLAVIPSDGPDDDRVLRAMIAAGRPVVEASRDGGADSLAASIGDALRSGRVARPALARTDPDLLASLAGVAARLPPAATRAMAKVSVCLLHRFRPGLLATALGSVRSRPPLDTEVVVVDNAGDPPLSPDDPRVRIVRLDRPLPPGAAYNRGAASCRGDAVVFLDDDNVFAAGGLDRFATALGTGWFDVVVTSLDVVDGDAATGPSSGRTMFLGDAGAAGLFFNGFGDTALAMTRDAFERIGGFPEPGHLAPAWDWVLLAKARAAGLRIGVLMEPAVRYARRVGGETNNWLKLDREGARRAVLDAYGDSLDAPLIARVAQGLQRRA